MHKLIVLFTAIALMVVFVSCGSEKEPEASSSKAADQKEVRQQRAPEDFSIPDDATTTPSGLKYVELKKGDGKQPQTGQTVVVHYTGWTMEGKKFDSSIDRGEPFAFSVGKGDVIAGWDEGISTMKVGGKRRLFIPPHLAYGSRGIPGLIPPDATLVFDARLIDIK